MGLQALELSPQGEALITRNNLIAVEQALGIKSMAQLAAEHGLHQSRIGQICLAVRHRYRVEQGEGQGKALILAIMRNRYHADQECHWLVDSPEKFLYNNGHRNAFV